MIFEEISRERASDLMTYNRVNHFKCHIGSLFHNEELCVLIDSPFNSDDFLVDFLLTRLWPI